MHQDHPHPPVPYHDVLGCDHMWGIPGFYFWCLSKEGWRNQQTAALPDYLCSFSSLHPCTCHTLILIIFQDSILTNGLSAYVNHILQDKPKKVLHPNRRGEREPLQNPLLLVLHINEARMCTTHSRPHGQACRSPPIQATRSSSRSSHRRRAAVY